MQAVVHDAIRELHSSGLAKVETTQGCTSQEIELLEAECGLRLPETYKEFLRFCGKKAGLFLVGTDWTYPKLKSLQASAQRLLLSCNGTVPLSQTAFVFAMHQGYEFLFFECNGDDDPSIYLFLEGYTQAQLVFQHFSEWLAQCVKDEIATYEELK